MKLSECGTLEERHTKFKEKCFWCGTFKVETNVFSVERLRLRQVFFGGTFKVKASDFNVEC